ncbi:MAG: hypothetical protein ACJA2O_004695, partial [Candidatus Azotimanducaceae bacterium]
QAITLETVLKIIFQTVYEIAIIQLTVFDRGRYR